MPREVYRTGAAFWRLWDRGKGRGAVQKSGTACLVWNTTAHRRHPCHCPKYGQRIVGIRDVRDLKRHQWAAPFRDVQMRLDNSRWLGSDRVLGYIEIWGQCGKCDGCLAHRKLLWISRTSDEFAYCRGRVWLCHNTFRPFVRRLLERQAIAWANARGDRWHDLPEQDRLRLLGRAAYHRWSQHMKRVRAELLGKKKTLLRVRFFCVIEPHKDGFPHIHALVFEEALGGAGGLSRGDGGMGPLSPQPEGSR